MKPIASSIGLAIMIAGSLDAQEHRLVKMWETKPMLKVPESVLYDAGDQVLYVSNVGGKNPWARDGNGSIGKVGTDGTIIAVDWVNGLHAPKGMGLRDGLLYVADLDRVVVIDVSGAAAKRTIEIEGAKMLNDITINKDGVVFVSDSATGKVHSIKDGKVAVFLEGLKRPNGLHAQGDDFYVLHNDGLYKVAGDKTLTLIAGDMEGGVDGVERLPGGDFIVSCWGGVVYYVTADGKRQTLLDTREKGIQSADIGWDPQSRTLFVPTFFKNNVVAYEVR